DRGVRHAQEAARLEDGGAARDVDETAVRICHPRDAVPALPMAAQEAGGENGDDRAQEDEAGRGDDLRELLRPRRRRAMELAQRRLDPGRIRGELADAVAGDEESQ